VREALTRQVEVASRDLVPEFLPRRQPARLHLHVDVAASHADEVNNLLCIKLPKKHEVSDMVRNQKFGMYLNGSVSTSRVRWLPIGPRTSVAMSAESSFFVPFYPPILQDTGNTGFRHILILSHAGETVAKMLTFTILWTLVEIGIVQPWHRVRRP
jgi:hypothetical protein